MCAPVVAPRTRAQAYSADDLVRFAIEKNRELQATHQRVVEARGLLRQTGIRPAPSFRFEGATDRPWGSTGKEEYAARILAAAGNGGKREKRTAIVHFWAVISESRNQRIRVGGALAASSDTRYATRAGEPEAKARAHPSPTSSRYWRRQVRALLQRWSKTIRRAHFREGRHAGHHPCSLPAEGTAIGLQGYL